MNAMTDAVRKRKRTCASVCASRNVEDEEDRQSDELDPARDRDRRAASGHAGDRTEAAPGIPRRRPGSALATLLRSGHEHDAPVAARCPAARTSAAGAGAGAVARPRRRRRRAPRGHVRGDRLLGRGLGARDRCGRCRRTPPSRPRARSRSSSRPSGTSASSRRSRRTASRRSASTAPGEGALVLQPVGPQANEGLLARLWHRITGSEHRGLPWYQLESGSLTTLDVGAVPGTDVYSPVDGTVVAIRDHIVSGRRVGLRDRAAPVVGALARRRAPARRHRPGALRRTERRGGVVQARDGRRHHEARAAVARALLGRQRRERRHPGVPVGDARRALDRRPRADPLRRRRRGHARAQRARGTSPRPPGRARHRRVRRERRERRQRRRDHAAPRRPAARRRRGRDHARQPRVPAHGDRPVPRRVGPRHPAGEHVRQHARARAHDRPDRDGDAARRDQRPRLALPPPRDLDVRGGRRARRRRRGADAARARRRPCGGDEREGRARALARRQGHGGRRHPHARADVRRARAARRHRLHHRRRHDRSARLRHRRRGRARDPADANRSARALRDGGGRRADRRRGDRLRSRDGSRDARSSRCAYRFPRLEAVLYRPEAFEALTDSAWERGSRATIGSGDIVARRRRRAPRAASLLARRRLGSLARDEPDEEPLRRLRGRPLGARRAPSARATPRRRSTSQTSPSGTSSSSASARTT